MLTYAQHYDKCKENSEYEKPNLDLYEFDYAVIHPSSQSDDDLVTLPDDYMDIVNAAKDRYKELMKDASNLNIPRDPAIDFAIRLQKIHNCPEFEELAQLIMPQLERRLFGCPVVVEALYVYKNLYREAPQRASWIWHYDNNPKEIIKVMIYLSDVGENSGAFEVICNDEGDAVKMQTHKVDYRQWNGAPNNSRITEAQLSALASEGYYPRKILGQKGTIAIFDNNIAHRASIPDPGNTRDAMVFMIRPWLTKEEKYINQKHCRAWTGSSIFMNPEEI
tara:strand:+ start:556 stop:1389 length:834 start_codon:yes stop_codon:yes gene_type:complete